MTRFGIEEEFVLLDPDSLVPLAMDDGARQRLVGFRTGGVLTTEYLTSQLETATEPMSTRADADIQLRELRGFVGSLAQEQHAIAAPTGNPFATTRSPIISPSPHYDDVARRLGHLTRDHEVNGLHVHVEVVDAEERIRALNRVRGWLPVLLALTGNSPFANGIDTGFASWRSVLIRRLPSSWCPPRFHDVDDYNAQVRQLVALGSIGEPASLSWAVRASENYPTVEVRVFDTQLQPEDSVLAAVLCRALMLSDDRSLSSDRLDGIDASLWTAARDGMHARIIDPTTGEVAEAWDVADRMLAASAPALREFDDHDFVADGIQKLRSAGTGATRQRRAFERDGSRALAELLGAGTRAR